jgi:aspartyl-tRNA(Asn)/glutamyl-tRNA(Gln) amidotransferase subunit C
MPDFDIAYVAHLARLELTDEEQAKLSQQLAGILDHFAELSAVDVTGVEPTAHAIPLSNVLRQDEPRPCIERERILKNAPETARDLFIVPKIVE